MATGTTSLLFNRFGLGPRPGDLNRAWDDARDALEAEINDQSVHVEDASLRSAADSIAALRETMTIAHKQRQDMAAGMSMAAPAADTDAARPAGTVLPNGFPPRDQIVAAEALAWLKAALACDVGYSERLIWFWSNHFAVSIDKSVSVRASAGALQREAIRPNVFGRFADMLAAVELHPAMLTYLDNEFSVGPNSPAGRNRRRGLNENLGREILELHTLGVNGGYSQVDVTNLARILTGWTIVGKAGKLGPPGSAVFNTNWHEPGDFPVLGKTYSEQGPEQARAVLRDLARHPATARHIAAKLAKHFVADDPPPSLVDDLTAVYRDTDGNLRALSLALVKAPSAWSRDSRKIRSPQEFMVAAFRLFGTAQGNADYASVRSLLAGLKQMGQPLWAPGGPNGYPDSADDWGSPEGVKLRLDIAARLADRAHGDPRELLAAAFGPDASDDTRAAIQNAASRAQAITLLLMAPEFQWR